MLLSSSVTGFVLLLCSGLSVRGITVSLILRYDTFLPETVQAVLKDKGSHTNYWLSCSLEFYNLRFCCVYSFYSFFQLYLPLIHFPSKIQEMKCDSKTLHIISMCEI